jgi:hypothetical protein
VCPLTLFSFNHVDYLQQVSLNLPPSPLDNNNRHAETSVVYYRKLLKIKRIVRIVKEVPERIDGISTEELLIGLYFSSVRVALLVTSKSGSFSIQLGTWLPSDQHKDAEEVLNRDVNIIKSLMNGIYQFVGISDALNSDDDDDDKAFVIGLIMIRLVEHRHLQGHIGELRHILVIEEGPRLLRNVGSRSNDREADPRCKAVEAFSNLLPEIRAYGQVVVVVVVVISDQVPIGLAPDVIKNTNLKIAHRVVAEDDRLALASSMSTNELQANSLVTLKIGEAAVRSIGYDYPLLVKMDLDKELPPNTTLPTSLELKRLMSESVVPNKYKEILLLHPALNRIENEAMYETTEVVRTILRDPEL